MNTIPGVVDIHVIRGENAPRNVLPDLVIEIPHGATSTIDFTSLEKQLTSPLPPGLIDFFHVNTDAGAPELGHAIATAFVAAEPDRSAVVLRCRVPRTFIDCNRRIDAAPEDFKAGKVTPGLMPWITTDADRALLRGLYDRYVAAVREALSPTAAMLLLHTYAPRTVDVEVDANIGANLRNAYEPDVEPTWPLRPEIDIISRGLDGTDYAPAEVVSTLRAECAKANVQVGDGASYPMHPSTLAHDHVMARPGRALCVEVRRDLLADPFVPFEQMKIGEAKVARLTGPFLAAVRRWFA